jgi:hypothetical protein
MVPVTTHLAQLIRPSTAHFKTHGNRLVQTKALWPNDITKLFNYFNKFVKEGTFSALVSVVKSADTCRPLVLDVLTCFVARGV